MDTEVATAELLANGWLKHKGTALLVLLKLDSPDV